MSLELEEERLRTRRRDSEIMLLSEKDQATKSIRRMPWYMAPKKDVTSCEKLRGGANIRRAADIRMRELSVQRCTLSYTEYIGIRGEPGELKHLSTRRKRK